MPNSSVEARAALGAFVGGVLWAVKSLGILLADYQPEFVFGLAPFFFGVAAVGVAANVGAVRAGAGKATAALAIVATVGGGIAALLYLATGDGGAFGVTIMVSVLSLMAVLVYGGWLVRHWSVVPFTLACVMVLGLPVGGALSEIDERLLEIPLLIVSAGWIGLGLRFWRDSREDAGEAPLAAAAP